MWVTIFSGSRKADRLKFDGQKSWYPNIKPYRLNITRRRVNMIKAILIFNNHGKPRLIRFYQYFVSIVIFFFRIRT